MKNRFFRILVVFALLMGFAVRPVSAARDSTYTIIDLGTLGGTYSMVSDINDRGQVVGESTIAESFVSHAFLWEAGVAIDLGSLGGNSTAFDINRSGQVVGNSDTAVELETHAFLWEDGVMIDLGT